MALIHRFFYGYTQHHSFSLWVVSSKTMLPPQTTVRDATLKVGNFFFPKDGQFVTNQSWKAVLHGLLRHLWPSSDTLTDKDDDRSSTYLEGQINKFLNEAAIAKLTFVLNENGVPDRKDVGEVAWWKKKRSVPSPSANLSFFYSMSKCSQWCHLIGEFFHKHDKFWSNDKALKTKTIRKIKTWKKSKKLRKKERFSIWRRSEGCQNGQNRDQGRGQGEC